MADVLPGDLASPGKKTTIVRMVEIYGFCGKIRTSSLVLVCVLGTTSMIS